MYLKKIQINGFGKLQDKSIELNKKINVILGENETGKSTLANFIKSIFYGVNKNKDGKKYSDYEKFSPWLGTSFNGVLTYEYADKEYTVYRDFNKNNGKVYDELGNDITNDFNKDRARGVEIGLAHLKIDETTFENSLLVKQSEVELDATERQNIIQKLTNMVQLGEEGQSYEKIKNKLEKMALDEIGTSRTQNKPINIVNKEILNYTNTKNELIYQRERNIAIENKLKELNIKREKDKKSFAEVQSVYNIKKKYEALLEEKINAYDTARKMIEKEKAEYKKQKLKRMAQGTTAIFILFVIIIGVLIAYKQYILGVASIALAGCFILLYRELEKREEREFEDINFDIIKEELNKKEQKELQDLEKSGAKRSLIDRKINSLKELLDGYEKSQREIELEEHKLNIEINSIKRDVLKLNEVEENLKEAVYRKEEILKLQKSIDMALNTLEESYNEIKREVIPEISRLIKEYVGKTTNGIYTNVIYNDVSGLLVENTNGELISIDKLSIGTIDQIYLGFRLAISNKLENIPIILDETFVYFDDVRLENILKILQKISEEKQIVILSCSNRELEIFRKNRVDVNVQIL